MKWRAFRALQLGRDIWQEVTEEVFDAKTEHEAAKLAFAYVAKSYAIDADDIVLRVLPIREDDPNNDWTRDLLKRWDKAVRDHPPEKETSAVERLRRLQASRGILKGR